MVTKHNHVIVFGLAFGDEGKGGVTDYLARKAKNPLVVRFNGGSQAAHNVVTPDRKHHTFAQFGSGTLAGAPTHLSQFTVLNPLNMHREAQHLMRLGELPFKSTTIAESALIITPYHIAANKMREDHRGDGRHGSTGQGIGETVESAMRFPHAALRAGDLIGPGGHLNIQEKFGFWRRVKGLEMEALGIDIRGTIFDDNRPAGAYPLPYNQLNDMAKELWVASQVLNVVDDDWLQDQFDDHDVIFEGAQGVLLDERLGFHPHTTWSKTTPHNAMLLLGGREAFNLGVTRSYTTRHGAGPFVTDMGSLGDAMFPEHHNGAGEYQGAFRRGAFDFLSLTYAADSLKDLGMPLDGIAVTHMGRVQETAPVCWKWRYSGGSTREKLPTFKEAGYPEPCLEHQALIRAMTMGTTPEFESMTPSELSETIETELEADIVIESWGPTHEDKKDFMPAKVLQ